MLPVICCVYLLSAEYTFMGSLIIREVIKDLIPKGIKQAKVVMLSGTRWVCFIAHALMQTTAFGREPASPVPSGPSPCLTLNKRSPILGASSCQQWRCLQSSVNNDIMSIKGPCPVMVNIPPRLATWLLVYPQALKHDPLTECKAAKFWLPCY